MTALSQYARLEATGLWRATPEDQRREVVVSLGDATLTITSLNDQPLAHWSLAAVARANPGERPALFHPDGDPGETLELADDEGEMIAAIEKLRKTIERHRPHPGRLRLVMFAASVAAVAAVGYFWLPDPLLRHTVSVVPPVKRAEIGDKLMQRITRVTGHPCNATEALPPLDRLGKRVYGTANATRLHVLRSGVPDTTHLPGGIVLMNRSLVEDPEEPDVPAGYLVAERLRAAQVDPLERLLRTAGLSTTLRLLTTGQVETSVLDHYAELLLTETPASVPHADLLRAFDEAQVPSSPYAFARDVTGEQTIDLIEADPYRTTPLPRAILSDADWIRLQGICGG